MRKFKITFLIILFSSIIATAYSEVVFKDNKQTGKSYGLDLLCKTDMGLLLEEGGKKSSVKGATPFQIRYAGTSGTSLLLYEFVQKDFKKNITFHFKMRIYPCQVENTMKDLSKDQKVIIASNALSCPPAVVSDLCGFSCIFTTYQNNDTSPVKSKFWIWSQENIFFSLSRQVTKRSPLNVSHSCSNIAFYDIQDVKMTFDDKQNLMNFAVNGEDFKYMTQDNFTLEPSLFYGFHARKGSNMKIEVSEIEIYIDEKGNDINTLSVSKYPQHEAAHYEKSANAGDPDAMYRLGMAYFDGRGVERDYLEAFKWFQRAAQKGHVFAISMTGTCYYKGIGVEQSKTEAEKWFQKGADRFYGDSIYRLAYCKFESDMVQNKSISKETLVLLDTAISKLNSNAMILRAEYEKMNRKNSEDENPMYYYAPAATRKSADLLDIKNITVSPVEYMNGYNSGCASYDSNPKGFYGFAEIILGKKQMTKEEREASVKCLELSSKGGFIPAIEKLKALKDKNYKIPDKSAEKEKAENLFKEAKSLMSLNKSENNKEILRMLEEASCLGHKQASYELGVYHYKGLFGVTASKKEAAKYWDKFEKLENIDNMTNMIYMPLKAKYAFGGIMD